MPDSIPGPQGGTPARITERLGFDDTDVLVEHRNIGLLSKHWSTSRAETVRPGGATPVGR
jgi:hypothetical protein